MTTNRAESRFSESSISIEVVEPGKKSQVKRNHCQIARNIVFDAVSLQSYFFSEWNPKLYDALLLAGAVEYCDRVTHRPVHKWSRDITLKIPVHDSLWWNQDRVLLSLSNCLGFLTGDRWNIHFVRRSRPVDPPPQLNIPLKQNATAVMPFSDGLDSLIVSTLFDARPEKTLIRIRLGLLSGPRGEANPQLLPFNQVPYSIKQGPLRFVETSARSRGFKYSLVAGIAAYLAKVDTVIVPESGQGALGPSLVPVGQAYEDYRSHPLFTTRMEGFLELLLDHKIKFIFPQIWMTKGESLKSCLTSNSAKQLDWNRTKSCWQQSRQVSVSHRYRQCGVCAACMLRRLSIHAAGLSDSPTTYACENLKAPELESAFAREFDRKRITRAMQEYAIAGVLHLAHIASTSESGVSPESRRLRAQQLAQCLEIPEIEANQKLERLLEQHRKEWKGLLNELGPRSFVTRWGGGFRS